MLTAHNTTAATLGNYFSVRSTVEKTYGPRIRKPWRTLPSESLPAGPKPPQAGTDLDFDPNLAEVSMEFLHEDSKNA